MISSFGQLVYSDKLIVEVDPEIGRYYRWFLPKSWRMHRPLYAPHISVIRGEAIQYPEFWGKYNNVEIAYEYDTIIHCNEVYAWLEVRSEFLKNIRLELGLPPTSNVTKSPDQQHEFHITLANNKR